MARKSPQSALSKVPLFAGLSPKELKLLASLTQEVTYPVGKQLTKQGSVGYECLIVVEGQAKVERDEVLLTVLGPGDYVGELAMIDKGVRSATVTAVTELTAIVMGPREFTTALDKIPTLSRKLLAELAQRVRALDSRVVSH
jgi:CRP/FNR family transcriptional regulator, cyclic AMP receptor protein